MQELLIEMTKKLIEFLEKTLDDEMILNSFIRNNLVILKQEGGKYTIGLENEFCVKSIKDLCEEDVIAGIKKLSRNDNASVDFVITADFKKQNQSELNVENKSDLAVSVGLNKKQTFENFFEESFNSEAYFGSKKILEDFAIFNPLIIVGRSGLGKTHLLNSIGVEFLKKNRSVVYVNSNSFTDKFVNNINKNLSKIKENYAKYDVLIIDDFQMFENRPNTLAFLFEIFNDFIEVDKQIVIGSEKSINKNLKGFPDRFLTRLMKGISLNISEPSKNDLKNLLIKKLKEKGFDTNKWNDEAIDFLVRNSDFNIRSVEGKINRIIFFKKNFDDSIFSYFKLKKIFNGIELDIESINPLRIISVVCDYYKFSKNQIVGKKREQSLVLARDIAIYFMRKILMMTYSEIGKHFSNRNHSTIINSINKVELFKTKDPSMNEALKIIESKIYKFE